MPSFSGLLIVVAVAFAAPKLIGTRRTVSAGLMQATSLPFIVAATAIGQDLGLLSAAEGAALIGAGLLSVLIFPLAGLALLREPGVERPAAPPPGPEPMVAM